MGREIKFRTWNSKSNTMIIQGNAVDENRAEFWRTWETSSHVSDPMQFTGLTDKNGKEIYEDDIIKSPNGFIGRIVFADKMYVTEKDYFQCYGWIFKRADDHSEFLDSELLKGEVIGNIYENPELL